MVNLFYQIIIECKDISSDVEKELKELRFRKYSVDNSCFYSVFVNTKAMARRYKNNLIEKHNIPVDILDGYGIFVH
ncbi:hypothetical protein HYV79_01895 [Candidatus Woesearchaeota archaeon]|nr:hypothetical protein [Candidatus Woesearchaeota archaeon]